MTDPRVTELEELAREEGITLPMPVEMIVYFERQGRVVCLVTGKVYCTVIASPTPHAKAVAHLLAESVGEVAL